MANQKILFICLFIGIHTFSVHAQDDNQESAQGFPKDRLFTGGSVSLGFSNNSFQAGLSPFFGYSLAPWLDAGIAVNWSYVSFRDVYLDYPDDKIRKSTYGGGAFIRAYPISFLFLQVQPEHNFITEKFIPGNGGASIKNKEEANSLLLGAGYATGRYENSGQPFFYFSLLFDVLNSDYSPYSSSTGNIVPIVRAGLQVPLFQGRSARKNLTPP